MKYPKGYRKKWKLENQIGIGPVEDLSDEESEDGDSNEVTPFQKEAVQNNTVDIALKMDHNHVTSYEQAHQVAKRIFHDNATGNSNHIHILEEWSKGQHSHTEEQSIVLRHLPDVEPQVNTNILFTKERVDEQHNIQQSLDYMIQEAEGISKTDLKNEKLPDEVLSTIYKLESNATSTSEEQQKVATTYRSNKKKTKQERRESFLKKIQDKSERNVPRDIVEALKEKDDNSHHEWRKAYEREMESSVKDLKIFTTDGIPSEKELKDYKFIPMNIVLDRKRDGTAKVRNCADGSRQKGINLNEIFSPVIKYNSL